MKDKSRAKRAEMDVAAQRRILNFERRIFHLEQKLASQTARYKAQIEKQAAKSKAENDALRAEAEQARRLYDGIIQEARKIAKERQDNAV